MRTLLINAATMHVKHKPALPLGLLSIAKFLADAGHTVKIYDRTVENGNIRGMLDDFKPDIIGISALTNKQFRDAAAISSEVKKRGLPVVWGGATPSAIPEIVLKSGVVDYVVIGEGEEALKELLDALENKKPVENIAGLAYFKDGKVFFTNERACVNLAEMPVLDFTFVKPEKYFTSYFGCRRMLYLYASKGCPGKCYFCYNHCFHKHKWRKRPIEYCLEEIKYLIDNYGMDGVMFADDLFSPGPLYTKEVCQKILDSGLKFSWGCSMRSDTCTEEEMEMMYKAGCRWILFGIETGSPERQKIIGKNLNLEKTHQIIDYCKKIGIVVSVNFIIGFPDETVEELETTVEYMRNLHADTKFTSFLGVLPGSELYDKMINEGHFKGSDTFMQLEKFQWVDILGANYSKVPDRDLKVVWACFSWQNLFAKSYDKKRGKESRTVLLRAISQTGDILKDGSLRSVRMIIIEVRELAEIAFNAAMFPKIRKKYHLNCMNGTVGGKK